MLHLISLLLDQLLTPIREASLVFIGRASNTTYVLLAASSLGAACGLVGCFGLLRRRALMADALSHATLPGICITFLLLDAMNGPARSVPLLLIGALASGLVGVLAVQWISRHSRLREDASIGMVLSSFFGLGIIFLDLASRISSTPAAGLHHLIYGHTAAMTAPDALAMGAIMLLAAVLTVAMLKEFTLVCFNDAFASASGWSVSRIDLALMALLTLVTVVGIQAVGIILIVAMLIIPPATARLWTQRVGTMLPLAAALGAGSAYVGTACSAAFPRTPAGAVIVLAAGAVFLVSLLISPSRGIIAIGLGRVRRSVQYATDHALEQVIEQPDARIPAVMSHWLRFRRFARRGSGGQLQLTPSGDQRGVRVARNHRLWQQYLITHADIAPTHVDWSVDQVEHVLSSDMIAELESALEARDTEAQP